MPGGRIYGLYVYDANRGVCCCELTPSHEFYPLGSLCADDDAPDEVREAIEDADALVDMFQYVHCWQADNMAHTKLPTERCKADEYDETWEALMENWRCNGSDFRMPHIPTLESIDAENERMVAEDAGQLILLECAAAA